VVFLEQSQEFLLKAHLAMVFLLVLDILELT